MIVSGHNSCWGTNVSRDNHVWAQTCLGTVLYGLNRVDTIMSRHKLVWAQMCLGTNVTRHKRVWAQSCGSSRVGPIMHGHKHGGTRYNMGRKIEGKSLIFIYEHCGNY